MEAAINPSRGNSRCRDPRTRGIKVEFEGRKRILVK